MREPDLGADRGGAGAQTPQTRRGAQVLAVLRSAHEALHAEAVADRLGVHVNTARFHLENLVRSGAVARTTQVRMTPGRPRTLYRAVHRPEDGRRSYRLLAEILAGSLATAVARPEQAAVEAGRSWGRALADRERGEPRPGAAAARQRLVDVLDRVGFAPEAVTEGRRNRILLHHCPFLEVAQGNPEIVCAVHAGLMDGVLSTLGARMRTERLEPFVAPELCVAHLTSRRRTRTELLDPARTSMRQVP